MRIQRHTLLIVHEGYSEGCLLSHLRQLYLKGSLGVALSMKNARGRGGRHVLEHAISVRRRTQYDEVAVLLDTDQDWNEAQRRRAQAVGIKALESSPCLESWLLRVNGHDADGTGLQLKREFERRYGGRAHDAHVYARHFPREVLDNARQRIEVLDQILRLIRA